MVDAPTQHAGPPHQRVTVPARLRYLRVLASSKSGWRLVFEDTDGSRIAVKQVHRPLEDYRTAQEVLRELRLLRAVRHPNVERLAELFPASPLLEELTFATALMDCD